MNGRSGVIYDAGALIAAERNNRLFGTIHDEYLAQEVTPVVPTTVLAQVWVGGARQVLLGRLLQACEIEPFTADRARSVGALRARSGHSDVVDVSVVECAWRRNLTVITSDPKDIGAIVAALTADVRVQSI